MMIATSYQGLLYLPHFICTLLREPRLCACKQQKSQISLRIRAVLSEPTRLLALETCYMQDPDNAGGGGGGGGGGRIASQGRFVPVFLPGNK